MILDDFLGRKFVDCSFRADDDDHSFIVVPYRGLKASLDVAERTSVSFLPRSYG